MRVVALVGFFLAAMSLPALALDPQLRHVKCAQQAQALLDQWDAHHDWRRQIIDDDNATVNISPTQDIGVWLETHVYKDHTIAALKTTSTGVVRVIWNPTTCAPTVSMQERKGAIAPTDAFTDEDLATLIQNHRAGVIFVWSPLMNYSEKGLDEIKRAARGLKIELVTLVDPAFKGDRSLAQDSKPVASLELKYQGLLRHYPSILVFSKGKIAGRVYSGYRDEATYRDFIKEQLAK